MEGMNKRAAAALLWGLITCASAARAEHCACNGDINNSGSVNASDTAALADCANNNQCGGCVNSCDLDCNGVVDFTDFGRHHCVRNGGTNCCHASVGACTGFVNPGFPPCGSVPQAMCEFYAPATTWHGEHTGCVNGVASPIPAASTWGMLAMALSMAIAGSVVMRSVGR